MGTLETVNFQFYAHDEGATCSLFITDGSGSFSPEMLLLTEVVVCQLSPENRLFTVCSRHRDQGKLGGLQLLYADDSKGLG